jgi:hypothetical protein
MNDEHDEFGKRAGELLRGRVDDIDGATRSRLAQARAAAVAAAARPARKWLDFRHLAPITAMASAAVLTVLFIVDGNKPLAVNETGTAALYDLGDMDLLADADGFDLAQETDLEFIEWAAAMGEQDGAGG